MKKKHKTKICQNDYLFENYYIIYFDTKMYSVYTISSKK